MNEIKTCVSCNRTDYGVYTREGLCVDCKRNERACREVVAERYAEANSPDRAARVRLRFDIALGVVAGIGIVRLIDILNSMF